MIDHGQPDDDAPQHVERADPLRARAERGASRDALELLLETRESVGRIAVTVGFASHSPFTDAFQREFGASPRAVRGSPCPLRVPRR